MQRLIILLFVFLSLTQSLAVVAETRPLGEDGEDEEVAFIHAH